MPDPVRLVLRHQGGAGAGEVLADPFELGQLRPRSEIDLPVGERVRPEHAQRHGRQGDEPLDPPPPSDERRAADHRGEDDHRRGDRERLPGEPRRAEQAEHDRCDESAGRVQADLPGASRNRNGDSDHGGEGDDREQHVGDGEIVGPKPKIARGPDAGELQGAERRDQVAQLARVAERAEDSVPEEEACDGERRDHERGGEACQEQRPPGVTSSHERPRGQRQGREEPGGGAHAQNADERRGRDGERNDGEPPAGRREERARQRGNECDERRGSELLHAAPERVAVEQGRLRAEDGGGRAPRPGGDHEGRELVQDEGEERREERQQRLKEPRRVLPVSAEPIPRESSEPSG